jgi:hypothetical protein
MERCVVGIIACCNGGTDSHGGNGLVRDVKGIPRREYLDYGDIPAARTLLVVAALRRTWPEQGILCPGQA